MSSVLRFWEEGFLSQLTFTESQNELDLSLDHNENLPESQGLCFGVVRVTALSPRASLSLHTGVPTFTFPAF